MGNFWFSGYKRKGRPGNRRRNPTTHIVRWNGKLHGVTFLEFLARFLESQTGIYKRKIFSGGK